MPNEPTVSYRIGTELLERQALSALYVRAMADEISPVRLPAFYKGQISLPGFFWMSRLNALVMYESRLEMVILLQLDFNHTIAHVVPQPFVLHYVNNSRLYRHTPDFFVRYNNGAGEVVNVKPKKYTGTDRNVRAFSACQSAASEMGFAYTTRSELDSVLLANLWWLSGYRRRPRQIGTYSDFLLDCALDAMTIGEIVKKAALPALMRPVLFYMIWNGPLSIDLYQRMNEKTVVTLAPRIINGS